MTDHYTVGLPMKGKYYYTNVVVSYDVTIIHHDPTGWNCTESINRTPVVPRRRIRGAITPFPVCLHGVVFKHRVNFTFTLYPLDG
jgi:hypothetical protein